MTRMKSKLAIVLALVLAASAFAAMLMPVPSPAAAAGEVPEISYVTKSADMGTPFTIMGEHLDTVTEVWLWVPGTDTAAVRKLDDLDGLPALPAVPEANAVKVGIISQPNAHTLIAKGIGENYYVARAVAPTVLWLKSASGWSAPYMFNKPDLYFSSYDKVLPGQEMSVFGIDLANADTNPATGLVMFRNVATDAVFWGTVLTTSNQNRPNRYQYSWDFKVPGDAVPGTYEVAIHNLNGGAYSWSNRLTVQVSGSLTLVEALSRPSNDGAVLPVYTLDKTYISRNIERSEYTSAVEATYGTFGNYIQTQIDRVSAQGGGTVTLPSGIITLNKPLIVKDGVILQGQGKGSTEFRINRQDPLKNVPGTYAAEKPMIVLLTNTGLTDLSVTVGDGALTAVTIDSRVNPRTILVKNTSIFNEESQNTANVFPAGISVLGVTKGLTIVGNEVKANRPLITRHSYATPHQYSYIVGNKFDGYPSNNSYSGVTLYTLANSIFAYNELSNSTRGFVNQTGMWRNWIYNNTFESIGGISNGSEVVLPENNNKGQTNSVTSATYTSVTIDSPFNDATYYKNWTDHYIAANKSEFYVYVLTGRGMGQFRKVTDNVGTTLQIAEPWNVVPDSSSKVSVIGHVSMSTNNLFVNNTIKDSIGPAMFIWGFAVENAIVGNEFYNAGSLMEWSLVQTPPANMTIYNYTANNMLINSGDLLFRNQVSSLYNFGEDPIYDNGNAFGNAFVRNKVVSPSHVGEFNNYSNLGVFTAVPEGGITVRNASYNMFSGNYVFGATNGIVFHNSIGNVLYSNKFVRIDENPILLIGSSIPYRVDPLGASYTETNLPSEPLASANRVIVRPGAVPASTVNLAVYNTAITASFLPSPVRPLSYLTDNKFDSSNYFLPTVPGPQYVQLDLGQNVDLSKVKLWHYYNDSRIYHNVIIQVSTTADFSSGVTTLFNNDNDNSSGQGIGTDAEYYEGASGLELQFPAVTARFIRCWVDGNSVNDFGHWTELQVFEAL
ncbi:MAG: hypothetical protein J7639_13885 [Paenibacillaceae bacterium]|nr:hypothetical protein [Paenibacillaceae bacterium]